MPRYRFSETVVYKSGNPWATYEAGEVYDLSADHGERWVRRQVAAEVKDDGAALPAPVVEVVAAVERGELSVNDARAELGMPEVPQAPRHIRNRRP